MITYRLESVVSSPKLTHDDWVVHFKFSSFLNSDTKLVHDWYVSFRHLLKAQPKFCSLVCRCTLFTYYSVWQELMADANILNFKRLLSYHQWRFAWYSFLDLLDIDYEEGFCCPICGKDNGLDIVICDATELSFRQELSTSLKSTMNDPFSGSRSTEPRGIGR